MRDDDQYMKDFWVLFEGLDRHGPGSEESTLRALDALPDNALTLLDIGCGTGASTMTLAMNSKLDISALDNAESSLATLEQRLKQNGIANVEICCASMENIPFEPGTFDVLWSEGSAYAMGFEKAIQRWKPLIKPHGHLVVSELVWNEMDHPQELTEFWNAEYPDMQTLSSRLYQIKQSGYQITQHFPLEQAAWDDYMNPLAQRVKENEVSLKGSDALEDLKKELSIFSRYKAHYDYAMFVLQCL